VLSRSKRAFVDKLNTTGDSPVSRLNRTVIKTALPDPPSPEPKPFEWQIVTSMFLISAIYIVFVMCLHMSRGSGLLLHPLVLDCRRSTAECVCFSLVILHICEIAVVHPQ